MNMQETFLTETKNPRSVNEWLQKIKHIDTLNFDLLKNEINKTMDKQFKPRDFISVGKASTRRSLNMN